MTGKIKYTISPLRYPGGKNQIYGFIKELVHVNQVKTYIEPYMGGAGVALRLLVNGDVQQIMVNDFDKAIYSFWYSVLNCTEELVEKIEETPITIEEWYIQKEIYKNQDKIENLIDLGFATLFLNRTNRSGILKGGVIGGKNQNGKYKLDCRFNKLEIIDRIRLISKFKSKIKLYNLDAEVFVKRNISKTKESFTFFDPPYFLKGPGLYTNFYKYENHLSLANTIKNSMKDKKWILTYDVSDSILDMYGCFNYKKYYLNYSVASPEKGIEFIFYSDSVSRIDEEKFLRIKN